MSSEGNDGISKISSILKRSGGRAISAGHGDTQSHQYPNKGLSQGLSATNPRKSNASKNPLPFTLSSTEIVFSNYVGDEVYNQSITLCNTSSQRLSLMVVPPKSPNISMYFDNSITKVGSTVTSKPNYAASRPKPLTSLSSSSLSASGKTTVLFSDADTDYHEHSETEDMNMSEYRIPAFGRSFTSVPGIAIRFRVQFSQSLADLSRVSAAVSDSHNLGAVPDLLPIHDDFSISWKELGSAFVKDAATSVSSYPIDISRNNTRSEEGSTKVKVVALPAACDVKFSHSKHQGAGSLLKYFDLGSCIPGDNLMQSIRLVNHGALPAKWKLSIVMNGDTAIESNDTPGTKKPLKEQNQASSEQSSISALHGWSVTPMSGVLAPSGGAVVVSSLNSFVSDPSRFDESQTVSDSQEIKIKFAPHGSTVSGNHRVILRLIQSEVEAQISSSISIVDPRNVEINTKSSANLMQRTSLMKVEDRVLELNAQVVRQNLKLVSFSSEVVACQLELENYSYEGRKGLPERLLSRIASFTPLSMVDFKTCFMGKGQTLKAVIFNTAPVAVSYSAALSSIEGLRRTTHLKIPSILESNNEKDESKTKVRREDDASNNIMTVNPISSTESSKLIRVFPTEGRIGPFRSAIVEISFSSIGFSSRDESRDLPQKDTHPNVIRVGESVELKASLVINARETNHRTTLPVHGVAVDPTLHLSHSRINFGACAQGEKRDAIATLNNINPYLDVPFEFTNAAHFRVSPQKGVVPSASSLPIVFSYIPRALGEPGSSVNSPAEVKLIIGKGLKIIPVLLSGYCYSDNAKQSSYEQLAPTDLAGQPDLKLSADDLGNLNLLQDGKFVRAAKVASIPDASVSSKAKSIALETALDGTVEFPPHITHGPLMPQYSVTSSAQVSSFGNYTKSQVKTNGFDSSMGTSTLKWVSGRNGPNDENSLELTRDLRGRRETTRTTRTTTRKADSRTKSPRIVKSESESIDHEFETPGVLKLKLSDGNSDLNLDESQYKDPFDEQVSLPFAEGLREPHMQIPKRLGSAVDLKETACLKKTESELAITLKATQNDSRDSSLRSAIILSDDKEPFVAGGSPSKTAALLREAPNSVFRSLNVSTKNFNKNPSLELNGREAFRLLPSSPAERKDCEAPLSAVSLHELSESLARKNSTVYFGDVCVGAVASADLLIYNPLKTHIWVQLLLSDEVERQVESKQIVNGLSSSHSGNIGVLSQGKTSRSSSMSSSESNSASNTEFPELAGSYPLHQLIQPGSTARFELRLRSSISQTYEKILRIRINRQHSFPISLSAKILPMSLNVVKTRHEPNMQSRNSIASMENSSSHQSANAPALSATLDFAFSNESSDFTITEVLTLNNPHALPVNFQWTIPQSKGYTNPAADVPRLKTGSKALALAMALEGLFSVSPTRGTVAPGESFQVAVTYFPRVSHPPLVQDLMLHVENGPVSIIKCRAQLEEAKVELITAPKPSHTKHLSSAQAAELHQLNRAGIVDFGIVPAGLSSIRTVSLRNTGSRVAVVKFGPFPAQTSVSPEVLRLSPGETAKVEVTATPPAHIEQPSPSISVTDSTNTNSSISSHAALNEQETANGPSLLSLDKVKSNSASVDEKVKASFRSSSLQPEEYTVPSNDNEHWSVASGDNDFSSQNIDRQQDRGDILIPFKAVIPVTVRGQPAQTVSSRPLKLELIASAAKPRVSIIEPELNFGAVSGTTAPEVPFTLQNESSIPLLLAFSLTGQAYLSFDFVPCDSMLVTFQQLMAHIDQQQQLKQDSLQIEDQSKLRDKKQKSERTSSSVSGNKTSTRDGVVKGKPAPAEDVIREQAKEQQDRILNNCFIAPVSYSQLPPHFASVVQMPMLSNISPTASMRANRRGSVSNLGKTALSPGTGVKVPMRRQSVASTLNSASPRIWLIYIGPGACTSPGYMTFSPTNPGVEHHLPLPIYLPSAPTYPPLQRSIYAITVPPRLVLKPTALDYGTMTLIRFRPHANSLLHSSLLSSDSQNSGDTLTERKQAPPVELLAKQTVSIRNNHSQPLVWAIGTPKNAESLASKFSNQPGNASASNKKTSNESLALARAIAAADPLAPETIAAIGVPLGVGFFPQCGLIPPGGSVDVDVLILPTKVGSVELSAPVYMHACSTADEISSAQTLMTAAPSDHILKNPTYELISRVDSNALSIQNLIKSLESTILQRPNSAAHNPIGLTGGVLDQALGAYTTLKLSGHIERPWLETDAPCGEVNLPVVPLGVVSQCIVNVTAHGFNNLELCASIPPETRVPIRVSFPQGRTLGPLRPCVPVQISFVSPTPVSFTTKLDLVDPDGNVPCGILVHGQSDNSIFTVLPYLFKLGKSVRFAQLGPNRPLLLMSANVAHAAVNSVTQQPLKNSTFTVAGQNRNESNYMIHQRTNTASVHQSEILLPSAELRYSDKKCTSAVGRGSEAFALQFQQFDMYSKPNSDDYKLALASITSYLDAAGILPYSVYTAAAYSVTKNQPQPSSDSGQAGEFTPLISATSGNISALAPVSNMGKQRERALTFSAAQALSHVPVDSTTMYSALLSEEALLLKVLFKTLSKAGGFSPASFNTSVNSNEVIIPMSIGDHVNTGGIKAHQHGGELHTLLGFTIAALSDPSLVDVVPYASGSTNPLSSSQSQRAVSLGSGSVPLPPAIAPFEDVIRVFDSLTHFLSLLQSAGMMVADIHPTDLMTKAQLCKLLRCPCYQDRIGREALFYILDLSHPLASSSANAAVQAISAGESASRRSRKQGDDNVSEDRRAIQRSSELAKVLGNGAQSLQTAVSLRTAVRAAALTAPSPARLRNAIRAREQAHEVRSQRAVLVILQQLIRTFILGPISMKTLRQLPGLATSPLLTALGFDIQQGGAAVSTKGIDLDSKSSSTNTETTANQVTNANTGDILSKTVNSFVQVVPPESTKSKLDPTGSKDRQNTTGPSLPSGLSNVYSMGERSVLAWLTYHARRGDPQLDSNGFICTNFDTDLRDGIVLAAVIRSHWPSIANLNHLARPRLTNTSNTSGFSKSNDNNINSAALQVTTPYEEPLEFFMCVANNLRVLGALTELGLHYRISAEQIAGAQYSNLLCFSAYLFHMLPHYTPSATIQYLNSALGVEQSQTLTLRNPSRAAVTYQVRIEGQGYGCKHRNISLPPSSSASLSVTFLPRFARPAEGKLILVPVRKNQGNSSQIPTAAIAQKSNDSLDKNEEEDGDVLRVQQQVNNTNISQLLPLVGAGLGAPVVCTLKAASVVASPIYRASASSRCYEPTVIDISFDNPLRSQGRDCSFELSIQMDSEPSTPLPIQAIAGLSSKNASIASSSSSGHGNFAEALSIVQSSNFILLNTGAHHSGLQSPTPQNSIPALPPSFILHSDRIRISGDESQISFSVTFLPWSVGKHFATVSLMDRDMGEVRVSLNGISTPPLPAVRSIWTGPSARSVEVRELELPSRNTPFEQARTHYIGLLASLQQGNHGESQIVSPNQGYASGSFSRAFANTRTGSAAELAKTILLPELLPRQAHFTVLPITSATEPNFGGQVLPALLPNSAMYPPPQSLIQKTQQLNAVIPSNAEIIVPPSVHISLDVAGNDGKRSDSSFGSTNENLNVVELPVVPARKLYPNSVASQKPNSDESKNPESSRQDVAAVASLLSTPCGPNKMRVALRPRQAGAHSYVMLLVSGIEIRTILIQTLVVAQDCGPSLIFKSPLYSSTTQHIPLTNPSNSPVRWRSHLSGPGAAGQPVSNSRRLASASGGSGGRIGGFTGPIEFWVAPTSPSAQNSASFSTPTQPVHSYPLTFTANRVDTVNAKLELLNTETNEMLSFILEGASDDPVPVDHLSIKCTARSTLQYTVMVSTPKLSPGTSTQSTASTPRLAPNTPNSGGNSTAIKHATYGPNGRPIAPHAGAYLVETDLVFVTPACTPNQASTMLEQNRVFADGRGSPMAVTLAIAPPIAGTYRGTLVLKPLVSPKEYIWYTVEIEVSPPRPESLVEVSSPLRGSATVVVPVTNHLETRPLRLDVCLSGPFLEGPTSIEIPPKATIPYEFTFNPKTIPSQETGFEGESTTNHGLQLYSDAASLPNPGSVLKTVAGAITFLSPEVGEFWHELKLLVKSPRPLALPVINANDDRTLRFVISNPLSSDTLMLRAQLTDPRHFGLVSPQTMKVAPASNAEVTIQFLPEPMGGSCSSKLVFYDPKHPEIGPWVYNCEGVGIAPRVMSPVTLSSEGVDQGSSYRPRLIGTCTVTNTFAKPIWVTASVDQRSAVGAFYVATASQGLPKGSLSLHALAPNEGKGEANIARSQTQSTYLDSPFLIQGSATASFVVAFEVEAKLEDFFSSGGRIVETAVTVMAYPSSTSPGISQSTPTTPPLDSVPPSTSLRWVFPINVDLALVSPALYARVTGDGSVVSSSRGNLPRGSTGLGSSPLQEDEETQLTTNGISWETACRNVVEISEVLSDLPANAKAQCARVALAGGHLLINFTAYTDIAASANESDDLFYARKVAEQSLSLELSVDSSSLKSNSRSSTKGTNDSWDDLKIRVEGQFAPVKSFQCSGSLRILDSMTGSVIMTIPIHLKARPPIADDTITLCAAPGERAATQFEIIHPTSALQGLFTSESLRLGAKIPFKCRVLKTTTPAAAALFDIEPMSGFFEVKEIDNEGSIIIKPSCEIVVVYSPVGYSPKPMCAELEISSPFFTWRYRLVGDRPKYKPPSSRGQSSSK